MIFLGIISEPEPEEIEEHFQRYRQQYTTSAPSDPNDPNSPVITKAAKFRRSCKSHS